MKSKSITTIIFSIIGIIFIAIAVYGAAVKKEADSEKYKGWKTYRNEEAGFELKYPGSFVVYEDKIRKPREHQYPKEIIFASKPRPERPNSSLHFYTDTGGYAIVVNSEKNPKGLSLEEWLHPKVLENIKKQKNHEIKIAGQKAFIAHRLAGEVDILDVDFMVKDKYFSIYLIPFFSEEDFDRYPQLNRNKYEDSIQNLHLMLGSFKLIEKPK